MEAPVVVWLAVEPGSRDLIRRKLELDDYEISWTGDASESPALNAAKPDLIVASDLVASSQWWPGIKKAADEWRIPTAVMRGLRPGGDDSSGPAALVLRLPPSSGGSAAALAAPRFETE